MEGKTQMRAMVTGATGFVGKELVRELTDNGIDVVAMVRNRNRVPDEWIGDDRIGFVEGNLFELDKEAWDGRDKKKVDLFYHLGWYGTSGMERADIDGQLANVKGTCEAVRMAAALGCNTFINAGSIMEYEVIELMNSGDYAPGMGNIYSTAKLAADYMARTLANSLSVKYINVIISNIYGAGEKSARFLNTTLRKMIKDETIPLTHGNQLYDFIYITDAVEMIRIAGLSGTSNGKYYIGNSRPKPLKSFLISMKNILESNSELEFGRIPFNVPMLTYEEFDTYKVERELGIMPKVSFEEGIIKMKEWVMKNGEQ